MKVSRKIRMIHLSFVTVGIIIIVILVGCGNGESDKFTYQIQVVDEDTSDNLKNVNVILNLPGNLPLKDITNDSGLAIFEIEKEFSGRHAELQLEKAGCKSKTDDVLVKENQLPKMILLSCPSTPVKQSVSGNESTATHESFSQESSREEEGAIQTEEVSTDQSVEEVTPPASMIETVNESDQIEDLEQEEPPHEEPPMEIIQVQAKNKPVKVYGGPDVSNPAIGTLGSNAIAGVIGKSENDEWFKIHTPQGKEGWVGSCEVDLISGNLEDIPIVWGNAKRCEESPPPPPPSCLTAVVERQRSTLSVDTAVIKWQNIPTNAAYYTISVYTITDSGGKAYVKELDRADFGTPNYTIGDWEFKLNNIAPNTPFIFDVTVYNAAGNVICTYSGEFTA